MRIRLLFLPVSLWLLLFSVSAWGQTRGVGGGAPRTSPAIGANPATNTSTGSGGVPLTNANDEGKIEFHTQTVLVQVPIVVTDKSGNHVRGLTKEDFEIQENGKDQKISNFEEIVSTNGKFPVVAAQPGEFTNLTLSEQQPRTVTVIALDTINTPFLDQANGRRELIKYLADSLDSGQVLALMIITSHGLKVVQGLTGDPTELIQVLKKAVGGASMTSGEGVDAQAEAAAGDFPVVPQITMGSNPAAAVNAFIEHGDAIHARFQQQNAIEDTMNAFLGIAWSLSGVPGRKSVIWATGGFPFALSSPEVIPGGYLSALYERAMQALATAQVSVYPVDVRGLVNTTMASGRSSRPLSARQMSNRTWLQESRQDTLNEFASMTGGKAYYNTNDLATSFKRAADDASSYYLATYYLDTHNDKAGWRNLKIKVNKKDTEVRARKGFFVTKATVNVDASRNSDLSYALNSPIEGTGLPVIVKWLGTSGDGEKKKAEFQLRLPPNSVTIESKGGESSLNFDIGVAAFIDGGKQSQAPVTVARTVNSTVSEAQLASLRSGGVGIPNSIELAPGRYVVRIVVRDNVSGKIGSVTTPLTVN